MATTTFTDQTTVVVADWLNDVDEFVYGPSIPRVTDAIANGKCFATDASLTIETSSLSTGRSFSIYNNSGSSITITQGSGVTLRLAGSATTGNLTLAQRGLATIWCNSGTEAIAIGAGLS